MHPLPYSLPSTPLQIDGRLNFNITAAASKLYHTAAEEKALSGVLHLLVVQDLHGPISSAEELQLERSACACRLGWVKTTPATGQSMGACGLCGGGIGCGEVWHMQPVGLV